MTRTRVEFIARKPPTRATEPRGLNPSSRCIDTRVPNLLIRQEPGFVTLVDIFWGVFPGRRPNRRFVPARRGPALHRTRNVRVRSGRGACPCRSRVPMVLHPPVVEPGRLWSMCRNPRLRPDTVRAVRCGSEAAGAGQLPARLPPDDRACAQSLRGRPGDHLIDQRLPRFCVSCVSMDRERRNGVGVSALLPLIHATRPPRLHRRPRLNLRSRSIDTHDTQNRGSL